MSEPTIKTETVFLRVFRDGKFWSAAEVAVPALGAVKIKDCLSEQTIEAVCREVEAALKQKMGLPL